MKNSPSKRFLSLLLCLVLFLSLMPAAAMAEDPAGDEQSLENRMQPEHQAALDGPENGTQAEAPADSPLGDGNILVYIVDDSTGQAPEHGSVTLPGYTYYPYAECPYRVSAGDTVTISASPEEGYALTELRVTYKRTNSYPEADLDLDEETNTFTVPARAYSITIHAAFASVNNDYVVDVYVNDGDTGNTVTADRTRAREGDLVTVTLNMNPGTSMISPGLTVSRTDSGATKVELTQLNSSTYTFVMPAYDVTVYAGFAFINYSVTNLLSDIPFEELRFELTVDKTENLHYGETVTATTMTYDTLLDITPVATYEADGQPVYLDLTGGDAQGTEPIVRTYTFVMPEHDVTVTAEHAYQGYKLSVAWLDPNGDPVDRDKAQPSFRDGNGESLAQNNFHVLPGTAVNFQIDAYDIPDCGVRAVSYTWEKDGETFEGSFTELSYDHMKNASGSFVMPEGDVTFTIVQDKAYYVNFEGENGSVSADLHKAFPGETVTVTATGTDPTLDHLIWELYSEDVTLAEVEGQPNARRFVMPSHDVGLKVRFTMQPVPYYERSWNGSRVVETEEECLFYTKLGPGLNEAQALVDGWYVVEGAVNISTLLVIGDAHLILPDGTQLKANDGVSLLLGGSLTVYGQSADSGTLYAHPNGVGIGGSGELIVQGGTIDAQGSSKNAAIGSAEGRDQSLFVTINGGNVNAVGGYQAAAIGGGCRSDGDGANGGVVRIHGGIVTVVGGEEAAGIGGGYMGRAGDITITGGRVNATGGHLGAAIGSGYIYTDTDHNDCVNQHITITGGEVYAGTNGNEAAAIGGGCGGSSGTILIQGGYIQVTSGKLAATIGGGNGGNCDVIRIEGGTVIASGARLNAEDIGAIGRGYSEGALGTVTIYSKARVTAGEAASSAQPVAASEKEHACRNQNYVKIEPCPHDVCTYTITADAHSKVCQHCSTGFEPESHDYDDLGVCTVCGYQGQVYTVSFDPNGGSGTMESLCCVPGRELMLPVCSFTAPEEMCFAGWQVGDDPELQDEDTLITPPGDLAVKAVWYYTITILDTENGHVTMDANGAFAADTVILTVTPAEGYALDSLTVSESHGGLFPLTKIDDTHYSFTMPSCGVTVSATFLERTHITLRFDAQGGTVEPASLDIQAGEAIGELPVPTREGGWKFIGWFTEPAETAFAAGQGTPVTAETTFDEDSTVYAHWRLPGDINGDGSVNNKDVIRLQKYLKDPTTTVNEAALDVNGDGKVNNKDLTRLTRWLKYHDVEIH